ncbi:hypothetical protein EV130_102218 [Rhizobium azibense]|uniref:SH3 domain-containing protein n=2 Tax=Rhizobium/Agrobacterium group TaxID=227290 RepID=A0A4R3RAZ3_9HYPH|nr:hypothetical protein EV130_102218 [Rhizobium azibense]TCU31594.1 hypothetical protein EV129_12656 [Rhizobium azibense]
MRRTFAYLTIATFFSTSAFADPAALAANVNFRVGPGTGFDAMRVIPQGEEVDIKECDAGASWCAASYSSALLEGPWGFASSQYQTGHRQHSLSRTGRKPGPHHAAISSFVNGHRIIFPSIGPGDSSAIGMS